MEWIKYILYGMLLGLIPITFMQQSQISDLELQILTETRDRLEADNKTMKSIIELHGKNKTNTN